MTASPTTSSTASITLLASGTVFALDDGRTEVGRGAEAAIRVDHATVSRRHFALLVRGDVVDLEPLNPANPTFLNGQPISSTVPLHDNDRVGAGDATFLFRCAPARQVIEPKPLADTTRLPPPPSLPAVPASVGVERTVFEPSDAKSAATPPPTSSWERIPISGTMLIGRDRSQATLLLEHPLVSRLHATVTTSGGAVTITDGGSANGTFVNGTRISAPTTLRVGDAVKIGPYLLHFAGDAFTNEPVVCNLELVCRNVSRVVRGPNGAPLTLLDDITLVFRPREFVCIIGPSGSGKSTLLNALAARAPASRGRVELNGLDLYSNFDSLKSDIAVVPQKDVVHELLTVESALRYTARLRLPPDMSYEERESRLESVLGRVGLKERRGVEIARLSGGQLKRTSLANEILSEPSLLFLDEVTSGLDEHSDGEMMRLFRQVADDGKTVVCITHSLANVAKTATMVVILTKGGKLAFVGAPAEACAYFGVPDLGSVYQAMETRPAEEWKAKFLAHPLYRTYVTSRLPAPQAGIEAPGRGGRNVGEAALEVTRQYIHLTSRYLRLMRSDVKTLITLAAQPALVGLILSIVIRRMPDWPQTLLDNRLNAYFFFLMVAAFWFGTNNAAKEIVKERQVYLREQAVILRPLSYYLSKFTVLGAISLIQVFFLTILCSYFTNAPEGLFAQLVTLSQITLVGTTLGLLISATSKSEDRAVATVPLVLIPQVILAGALTTLEGTGLWLGQLFVACFWANRSLIASLPNIDDPSYWPGFFLLIVHGLVFAGAAIAVLELDARRLKIRAMLRAAGLNAG